MTITRTHVERESARRMRRLGLVNGEQVRRMRNEAGVSLAALAQVVGVHKSHLARIEANRVQPSLSVLTAIGVALGADLSVRYFTGVGPRLHDRFQAPMLESLLGALDRRWAPAVEVGVTHPARGVIDLVLTDRTGPLVIAAELQSELRRLEEQIRWSIEKAEGLASSLADQALGQPGRDVSRVLVLRSTVATREIARRYEKTLAAAFPARAHDVFMALTTPTSPWTGPGIVWMSLHGTTANLMSYPPPLVRLGR